MRQLNTNILITCRPSAKFTFVLKINPGVFFLHQFCNLPAGHNDHILGNLGHLFYTQVHQSSQNRLKNKVIKLNFKFLNILSFLLTVSKAIFKVNMVKHSYLLQLQATCKCITHIFGLKQLCHGKESFCCLCRSNLLSLHNNKNIDFMLYALKIDVNYNMSLKLRIICIFIIINFWRNNIIL